MKTLKFILLAALISAFIIPENVEAQRWGGRQKATGFWDNWTINGNAGLTSFFGDLSIYDSEIMEKLTKESGPAMGAILTKHINNKFGVSGQLLYGGLKGQNNSGNSFEASFIEYNFHGRVNLVNIIFPDNLTNLGLEVYAGLGQFMFNVTKWTDVDGSIEETVGETGIPEFVYFGGIGAFYNINDRFGVTVDMAMRQAQNDKLDDMSKNDNFDYYTHLSIGISYHFYSLKKSGGSGNSRGRSAGRLPMRRRR